LIQKFLYIHRLTFISIIALSTTDGVTHSFAKALIDSGVTLEEVATLLGHSNLNTTRIYTTPGGRDLEEAVKKLEDFKKELHEKLMIEKPNSGKNRV